jgi:endonuclease/exonuclease/phosphatase family metal-dependent hydrolase
MLIFRKIFFALNLLTLIPPLLAALGPFISTEVWWMPGTFAAAMPWLLLIPVIWSLIWLFYNPKNIIANAIALVVNLPVFGQTFQLSFSYPLPSNKDITILSFNVKGFSYKYNNFTAIRDYIKNKNPDIICLQEFRNQIGKEKGLLIKLKKYLNIKNHYFLEKYPNSNFGLLILSRFPIEKSGPVPSENSDYKNVFAFADLKLYGQNLRVYNIHFQSYPFSASEKAYFEARPESRKRKPVTSSIWSIKQIWRIIKILLNTWSIQMQQLQNLNKHRNNYKGSLIICGDLNNQPYSFLYKEIRKNLQDSFMTRGMGFGKTYGYGFTSFRIDYIFVSLNFRVINFGVLATRHLSDHSAVIARIRFNFHN